MNTDFNFSESTFSDSLTEDVLANLSFMRFQLQLLASDLLHDGFFALHGFVHLALCLLHLLGQFLWRFRQT